MRRLLATIAIVFSLLFAPWTSVFTGPFAAHAQAPTDLWKIDKFSVELNVGNDGYLDVTEVIAADFLEPRHGIYRFVPEKGKFTDGSSYELGLSLVGVTMDGVPATVSTTHENGNVVWRIGDADVTMTGAHTYVIRYSARNAYGRFADHDELYWNISGDGWDVPMPNVSAKLILNDGVTTSIAPVCYTGAYGSKETDCTIVDGGTVVGFVTKTADTPLTIVAGFPKGSIGEVPFDLVGFIMRWIWCLIPILTFLLMYRKWQKDGKDADLGPIVAQYEPTDGLSPAQMLSLVAQRSINPLGAAIIHLAVKGWIDIEEITTDGILGMFKGKDYVLKLKKDLVGTVTDLKPHEHALLVALFDANAVAGLTVKVSSLKNVFYKEIPALNKAVLDDVVADGYFAADPNKIRLKWVAPGIVLIVVALLIVAQLSLFIALPLVATGLIIAIFGRYLIRWSDKGAKAAWEARGFKEFVTQVEKYRGPWMAEQNIFEKVLPYAMAFGVATKWAKAFDGLKVPPPQWYHGPNGMTTAFIASSFVNDLGRFGSDFNHTAVSTPQSRGSGSGFGGGGFSGGGGGGGGGGSW